MWEKPYNARHAVLPPAPRMSACKGYSARNSQTSPEAVERGHVARRYLDRAGARLGSLSGEEIPPIG